MGFIKPTFTKPTITQQITVNMLCTEFYQIRQPK